MVPTDRRYSKAAPKTQGKLGTRYKFQGPLVPTPNRIQQAEPITLDVFPLPAVGGLFQAGQITFQRQLIKLRQHFIETLIPRQLTVFRNLTPYRFKTALLELPVNLVNQPTPTSQ